MNGMKVLLVMMASLMFYKTIGQVANDGCEESRRFYSTLTEKCNASISTNNCVHLDVTESYDFEGKQLLFNWDMGDGTNIEGIEVEHCYDKPGTYVAVLSLFDPIAKMTIEDELMVDIVIKPEFNLQLKVLDSEVEDSVLLDYALDFPKDIYNVENTFWYMGDGDFSCENNPIHVFKQPGYYEISLAIVMSTGNDQQWLCNKDTIKVKLMEPDNDQFANVFDSIQIASRFLADDVHYQVMRINKDQFEYVSNLESLRSGVIYKPLVYRGDLVFDIPTIKFDQQKSSGLILDSINSVVKLAMEEDPLKFESLFFDVDQNELNNKNKRILKKNVALLNEFSSLNVLIGVYTSSKGALDKGMIYSKTRAVLIRDFMIENGIDKSRLFIADPNNYRSLINSCVTKSNCADYVDAMLDRRADFRIFTGQIDQ